MTRLPHLRHARPPTIEFTLGRDSIADLGARVLDLLRDPEQVVTVRVVGFDYFDENDVTALTDLTTWSPRVRVVGLDSFADQVLVPTPKVVDVRTHAERAVTSFADVTVVTAICQGERLDDVGFDQALRLAYEARRGIVTVDLRHVEQLTPAQIVTLAELSADLHWDLRTLIVVNAGLVVAAQLRSAGLSGGLRMSIDEDG
jgi:hypothetical protein